MQEYTNCDTFYSRLINALIPSESSAIFFEILHIDYSFLILKGLLY